jgi:hypothetical protein
METGVIGREQELAAVDQLLDAAVAGFACLALEGEPGIGKTTLWQEAVRRGEERGFAMLMSRPAPSEARLSFAGLADLLEAALDETLTLLPEPQRHALDVALLRAVANGRLPVTGKSSGWPPPAVIRVN